MEPSPAKSLYYDSDPRSRYFDDLRDGSVRVYNEASSKACTHMDGGVRSPWQGDRGHDGGHAGWRPTSANSKMTVPAGRHVCKHCRDRYVVYVCI
jgi:hypothetical protein